MVTTIKLQGTYKKPTHKDVDLLFVVAKRVADRQLRELKDAPDGSPRTDGETIWLPYSLGKFPLDEIEGLAAHEGSHIRFKSIIDPQIWKEICPENPQLGQHVLNVVEDARIEDLLSVTYPGFWDELDRFNLRDIEVVVKNLEKIPTNIFETNQAGTILLSLVNVYGEKHIEKLYDTRVMDSTHSFRLASQELGEFWKTVVSAMTVMWREKTFISTVIASKKIIEALRKFINDIDHQSSQNRSLSDLKARPSEQNEIMINLGMRTSLEMSGLSPKELEDKNKHALNELKDKLHSNKSSEELEKELRDIIECEREDIKEIIDRIQKGAQLHASGSKELEYSYDTRDNRVQVKVITDAHELASINDIKSPYQEYYSVVNVYRGVIDRIKKELNTIKHKEELQRGFRGGYISVRDLPQVVSSRGQFNRPFKLPETAEGADLLLVIDESGSMRHTGAINIARDCVTILAESLKGTKIDFAIVGFSAKHGESWICEKVYKRFDENPDPTKIGSMGVSDEFIENRDGSSFLSIAEHHFTGERGNIPIMIVVSDGKPEHGGTSYTGEHAKKLTAEAVRSLKSQSIRMFALSIDQRRADNYLRKIYGARKYHILRNMADLQQKLIYIVMQIAEQLK